MADQEDQNDMQILMVNKILDNYVEEKKIDEEQCKINKDRYKRLIDLQKNYIGQKKLQLLVHKIKQDVKFKREELTNAEKANEESEELVRNIQREVKHAEAEEEKLKKANEQLDFTYQVQHNANEDQKSKIEEEEKEKRAQIQPEEEKLNSEIEQLQETTQTQRQEIENYEQKQKQGNEKIRFLKKENENIMTELDALKEEKQNIHGRPMQFQKEAERRQNAQKTLNNDLEGINENILKVNKAIDDQQEKIKSRHAKILEVEDQVNRYKKQYAQLNKSYRAQDYEKKQYDTQIQQLVELKYSKEFKEDELKREIKRMNDQLLNPMRKMIQQSKKGYKKTEVEIKGLKDHIRELEMSIDKFSKEENELKYEIDNQINIKENIDEDLLLTENKKRVVSQKTEVKVSRKQSINQQYQDFEKQLAALQQFENDANKKVKMLTAMRETMARKASSAMAEVRETREELKIKELLILDLTKKHQETEFKLNSFKALYEEVKSARNKYVNLIQNSSQHLAELKERIKILQNELEILKNESQEKDSTLIQYKHILQQEVHKRDRVKQKLNKRNFLMRSKKQQVDQNINEIEKLNMIIMAIEKEMLVLRKQYEIACESRNQTGIQLIDRNDELCILYEKANIQENILKNGEQEIKKLEDEVRMIKIEIQEKKRQIDVARKQIQQVPILADKVIELKNTLEVEQEKDQKLSEQIENPENTERWRELKGEDPDSEALEAKIHVIEERLNNKKEQLLEKELILDEITNLSEKLRKQALEGRQNTLELSEKLNNFQARLKDITRKMMASIAELSMFQATELKLQQERDDLDKLNDEAQRRMQQGLPPTPETEIEYLKSVRDNKRYQEERSLRQQREALEKNFPPFATKTTAEHRVNAYVPEDLAIPKPYGKHAPFKPSDLGANIRHYKKPQIKQIEI